MQNSITAQLTAITETAQTAKALLTTASANARRHINFSGVVFENSGAANISIGVCGEGDTPVNSDFIILAPNETLALAQISLTLLYIKTDNAGLTNVVRFTGTPV